MSRTARRALAVALGTSLGFLAGGAALIAALDRAGVSQPPANLDVAQIVEDRLAELSRADPRHASAHVVVLGDSTSVPLPERLASALAAATAGSPAPRIASLAILGQTTWDEYLLSETIAHAEPDAVVVGVHLASFSETWRESFAKPEFAGWLPLRRAPEALRLPLHWVGLSTDELLWYRAIVASGASDAWRALVHEQLRVGQAARDADRWFAAALGSRDQHREFHAFAELERRVGAGLRFTRAGALEDYGPVLRGLPPSHPVLAALRALVATLERRGIATLVVVTPANVEHLARLGLLADSRLPESLSAIESAARASGGDFLDLHDALPDAAFVDATGHYGDSRRIDGAGLVAARLAPRVEALLADRRR